MKNQSFLVAIALLSSFSVSATQVPDIDIYEFSVYIKSTETGTSSLRDTVIGLGPDTITAGLDVTFTNNLNAENVGTLVWSVTNNTGGNLTNVSLFGFLDVEIQEQINSFVSEYGTTVDLNLGTGPGDGMPDSFEIDEPEFVFGNIISNLLAGALDDMNALQPASSNDVSMALGFAIGDLAVGETLTATFDISLTNNSGLGHVDPSPFLQFWYNGSVEVIEVNDDICDMPVFNSATDPGLYLYQTNCGATGVPQEIYLTAVGGGVRFLPFPGTITSDEVMTITEIGLETNDLLLPIPGGYSFNLKVGGAGTDTLLFLIPEGATTCLDVEAVFAGVDKVVKNGRISLPFLGACEQPMPPDDMQCGAPVFNGPAFHAWQTNCDAAPGTPASWQFVAHGGGAPFTPFPGSLDSDAPLSAVSFAVEPDDTFNSTSTSVSWRFKVGGSGQDGFLAEVMPGSETCLDAGTVKLGAAGIEMTGPFSLVDLSPCTAPPPPCGPPANLAAPGLYIWEECGCPAGEPQWQGHASGGNGPFRRYRAEITANQFGTVAGISLEPSDVLDSVPGDGVVDIDLRVIGAGTDGFTVQMLGSNFNGLFTPIHIPGGNLFVGANATRTSGSVPLTDTQSCPN